VGEVESQRNTSERVFSGGKECIRGYYQKAGGRSTLPSAGGRAQDPNTAHSSHSAIAKDGEGLPVFSKSIRFYGTKVCFVMVGIELGRAIP